MMVLRWVLRRVWWRVGEEEGNRSSRRMGGLRKVGPARMPRISRKCSSGARQRAPAGKPQPAPTIADMCASVVQALLDGCVKQALDNNARSVEVMRRLFVRCGGRARPSVQAVFTNSAAAWDECGGDAGTARWYLCEWQTRSGHRRYSYVT